MFFLSFIVYYFTLALFQPQLQLFVPWKTERRYQCVLGASVIILVAACLMVFYWSQNKWNNHPIARQLGYLGDANSNWRSVAASINIEFRRIDKFMSGIPTGRRIIVTDSWVMKTSTYYVYIAHQSDIHLSLKASEQHNLSYENMTSVQFIHIDVVSVNEHISPFTIRCVFSFSLCILIFIAYIHTLSKLYASFFIHSFDLFDDTRITVYSLINIPRGVTFLEKGV